MSNLEYKATLAITYLMLTEASNEALQALQEPDNDTIEETIYDTISTTTDRAREEAAIISEGLTDDQRETLIQIHQGWVLKLDDLIDTVRRLA